MLPLLLGGWLAQPPAAARPASGAPHSVPAPALNPVVEAQSFRAPFTAVNPFSGTHQLEHWEAGGSAVVHKNFIRLTGEKQSLPIRTMSPGYRARVVFCLMSLRNPHMLLLDEPTNPLDMDMIDSLARAIKNFSGGVVLVSHDFRLLEQVADTIWVCDEKKITPWKGDIKSYKEKLRKDMAKASAKMFTGTGVQ